MKIKWVALLTILISTTLIVFFYVRHHLSETESFHARKAHKPLPVKIWTARKKDLEIVIGAPGLSTAFKEVKIIPYLDGISVQKIFHNIGEKVFKGDILLKADKKMLKANLISALKRLDRAKIMLQNNKEYYKSMEYLFNKGLISKFELKKALEKVKDAEYELAQAKYDIKSAQNDLKKADIYSPCSGIIMEKNINEGEQLIAKAILFTIDQLDPILIDTLISEEYINIVKVGQKASIEFSIWPERKFKGIVYKIQPKVGNTKTFHVYIKIENKNLNIKPGLSCFVQIIFKKNCLVVPNIALLKTIDRKAQVFIVDKNNKTHIKEVVTGLMTEKFTEILKGIKPGDKIIISGLKGLRDEDVVNIKP